MSACKYILSVLLYRKIYADRKVCLYKKVISVICKYMLIKTSCNFYVGETQIQRHKCVVDARD